LHSSGLRHTHTARENLAISLRSLAPLPVQSDATRHDVMEDPKLYGALLNGVLKREYEGDASMTPEFLAEAVFGGKVSAEAVGKACAVAADLIARAAYEDYDAAQIAAFLKLRVKELTAPQREAFARFWRTHRARIHEAVRRRTTWDPALGRVAWRIDVKTRAMGTAPGTELSEPVAIVELHGGVGGVARFEMGRDQLRDVLAQVRAVERDIQAAAGATVTSVASSSSEAK